ncbi:unnamed protein product [Rotaria sordida]|uniref:Uncharacterized protein n=1 Tax=Rotaria sordida TaxID=392033 RepID=A0A815DAQ6_9BILA|nr:unnamed protein product [Rotaria sordida]CAF1569673.1 unnamed protein product [Rotaria sordida]
MVEVLYSLVDVNRRFDRLALDSLYINNLNMTDTMTINSFIEQPCSIDAEVISKISEKILPRIHSQVHKLTIEEFSIKPILLAVNYPQLYSLSLINFQEEMLYQHLTDDVILRDLLTKQITHLNIDIKKTIGQRTKIVSKIFALILSLCKKLTVFNFCHMFPTRKCILPICYLPSTNCMSLTLVKLTITVSSLLDCLYLFDGCLDSLSTLIINVSYIFGPKIPKYSKKKFLKLRCFSLSSPKLTVDYDDLIVPLLCQMVNLEELKLYLLVQRFDSTYIDGIQLYDQFLVYMTQLKKFTFNIKTNVSNNFLRVKLPSNEDIQHSFIGRGYQQVTSYIHYDSIENKGKCLIYSVPYEFDYFFNLDNSFQGRIFYKVRYLTMDDTIPFEHKLFNIISEDFPFLEFLRISNNYSPKVKEHSLTLITYPYLTLLDLQNAHDDYAELFLLRKNAYLPLSDDFERSHIGLTQYGCCCCSLRQIKDDCVKNNKK